MENSFFRTLLFKYFLILKNSIIKTKFAKNAYKNDELFKMGIVKGSIQSIQKIRQEQLSWLIQKITE
ncbi:hypothetical protein [Leptospira kirschneri]|uniref:hypothetical protein n=1 Tax=Leptospira kirschneri TaxID=29507 RepID=UPI0002D8A31A